jgi:hypothetical protein
MPTINPFKYIPKEIPEGYLTVKIQSESMYAKQFIAKNGERMQILLMKVEYQSIVFEVSYVNDNFVEFAESVSKGDEIKIYVFFTSDGIKRANIEWYNTKIKQL